jgi:hypothetical protein
MRVWLQNLLKYEQYFLETFNVGIENAEFDVAKLLFSEIDSHQKIKKCRRCQ